MFYQLFDRFNYDSETAYRLYDQIGEEVTKKLINTEEDWTVEKVIKGAKDLANKFHELVYYICDHGNLEDYDLLDEAMKNFMAFYCDALTLADMVKYAGFLTNGLLDMYEYQRDEYQAVEQGIHGYFERDD